MRCKRRGSLSSGALGLAAGLLLGLAAGLLLLPQQTALSKQLSASQQPAAALQRQPVHRDAANEQQQQQQQQQEQEPKPQQHQQQQQQQQLLFVGVMTARRYLDSRAKAVYESWGGEVPGRIGFFSSEGSRPPASCPGLPLLGLARVDDSYPPQKKSFLMLEHMWARHGERFEWFLRADDDLYVRTERLERLLRSVDSRRPLYIGQAGRGSSEERGRLALDYDENFCMGGPGVLISRETLRRIVPHIKHCLANLYTGHEDVELGRCVRKFAGISCTWNYEMQSILYHNSSGELAFTGKLKSREVHQAISMHPVKRPSHMYRLHNYMRSLKIQELQQKRLELQRDIDRMERLLRAPARARADGERRGPAHWDLVARSEYRLADANPRRRVYGDLREGLEDATREVMASINACSRQRGRHVEERQALYAYRGRGARGVDTVLDLLLLYKKYRGRKLTLPVRRHLYLRQHFTGLESRSLTSDETDEADEPVIHFLVPVAGRRRNLERFLDNYERVCLRRRRRRASSQLHVIVYEAPGKEDEEEEEEDGGGGGGGGKKEAIEAIDRLRSRYADAAIHVIEGRGRFSRARALDQAAERLRDADLMFFVDVDISFAWPSLGRIRRNALRSRRLYFPVVFSQYEPEIVSRSPISSASSLANAHDRAVHEEREREPEQEEMEEDDDENSDDDDDDDAEDEQLGGIDETKGFWRLFGFGIVALYKSDYETVGKFDLTIEGWGKEDVDLYEKAVRSSLQIFRGPDLGLVHVYHGISCDRSLSRHQYSMCRGTRADTYAGTRQLASFVHQNPQYLSFARAKASNATGDGRPALVAAPPPAA